MIPKARSKQEGGLGGESRMHITVTSGRGTGNFMMMGLVRVLMAMAGNEVLQHRETAL